MKSGASTDDRKRNDREIQEVLSMVEDMSIQAQLHDSVSTSSDGASVLAQLVELRPLVNTRLQEGTTG